MCGTTITQVPTKTIGLRCPICGGDIGDDLACAKCGKLFGLKESEKETGLKCPGCAKTVKVDDTSCKSCGLQIWMDETLVDERLDGLRCPSCGYPLGEGDEKCGACGFQVWSRDQKDQNERARKAIEDAAIQIRLVEEQLGEVPSRAATYLEGAKRVMEEGEADLALRRALLAADIATITSRQVTILEEAIRRAKDKMQSVEDGGGDASECKQLYQLSQEASKKKDFKVALRLALKCKILAEKIEDSMRRAPMGM